jgi:hypothetical protein
MAQLAGGGEGGAAPKAIRPDLAGSLKSTPVLDSWIRIAPDGHATVFSGKAELGQGIRTALLQVAAEELDLPPSSITFITADTALTPDEGVTSGSHSMQDGGTALANAGANVRLLLTRTAAKQWSLSPDMLSTTGDGHVIAPDGRRLGYGPLVCGDLCLLFVVFCLEWMAACWLGDDLLRARLCVAAPSLRSCARPGRRLSHRHPVTCSRKCRAGVVVARAE